MEGKGQRGVLPAAYIALKMRFWNGAVVLLSAMAVEGFTVGPAVSCKCPRANIESAVPPISPLLWFILSL